jgi:hypothetical protein
MKYFIKQCFSIVIIICVISLGLKAQTYVSGGIYSNTTWTAANSPYIVVDTVAVFPGITLTIQPGVVIKFENNIRLEIRQAKLIAIGTSTDSITFTSNNVSPSPGIWGEILFNGGSEFDTSKFNYCNFKFADTVFYSKSSNALIIRNSNFNFNNNGMYGDAYIAGPAPKAYIDSTNFENNVNCGTSGYFEGTVNYCNFSHNQTGLGGFNGIVRNCTANSNYTGIYASGLIENCDASYNQIGFYGGGGWGTLKNCTSYYNSLIGIDVVGDSVINCQIKSNGIGFKDWQGFDLNVLTQNVIEYNNIGIKLENSGNKIYCNKICNNTTYDLYYNVLFGSNTTLTRNNYWCATDSTTIASFVYDGYDNINLGLVSFVPFDTLQCYLNTAVPIYTFQNILFDIFPNPASYYLTVSIPTTITNTKIKIFNMLGEIKKSTIATSEQTRIDITSLTNGVYIIQISIGDKVQRQKFIKQ